MDPGFGGTKGNGMTKKTTITIRITGPGVWLADRHIEPGEIAAVEKAFADQLIADGRAVIDTAEVTEDDTRQN